MAIRSASDAPDERVACAAVAAIESAARVEAGVSGVHAVPNVYRALREARDAEREAQRRERRVQRARQSASRSRRLYGGASEEFPTYGAFHAFNYARDGLTCFA